MSTKVKYAIIIALILAVVAYFVFFKKSAPPITEDGPVQEFDNNSGCTNRNGQTGTFTMSQNMAQAVTEGTASIEAGANYAPTIDCDIEDAAAQIFSWTMKYRDIVMTGTGKIFTGIQSGTILTYGGPDGYGICWMDKTINGIRMVAVQAVSCEQNPAHNYVYDKVYNGNLREVRFFILDQRDGIVKTKVSAKAAARINFTGNIIENPYV